MKPWLCILLLAWSSLAAGHKASDSYLSLETGMDGIAGRWDIALRDLDYALGLDTDDDGAIAWGELHRRQGDIAGYALARLAVTAKGAPCALSLRDFLVDHHTDGAYAVLRFAGACPAPPGEPAPKAAGIHVDYRLFFDLDPQHRGLLRWSDGTVAGTAVLAPGDSRRTFGAGPEASGGFADFVREGIWHIWTGYDHLLFLLSLLLPAVLVREQGRWRRAPSFRSALWDVVQVVTAFTLAHSLTLSLAALGYVDLPSRWVESAIAASVVLAALNNLVPAFQSRRPALAFGFGLVHGLGFASVLSDLALPVTGRLWALLGFNLGVEIGQLAVVAAFLPLAHFASGFRLYRTAALQTGSAAIALVALAWLLERAFDLPLASLTP
jgi:hypothetical protein